SAQERLLRLGEQAHVHRALPATQNRAHRYRQNLMKVVQRGVSPPRVVQTLPPCDKTIQNNLPRRESSATRRNPSRPKRKAPPKQRQNFKCDSLGSAGLSACF